MTQVRIGQGVDVHAFSTDPSRPLVLGGVHVEGTAGLDGHSDADVVLHAITDALLGAAALGDLGELVGIDQPETANADSAGFLTLALERLRTAGWRPVNVDVTVVAQVPRLAPHVPRMRARVAEVLGLETGAVSVKATTTDRLGFIGQGEGVACLAVALVEGTH